MTLSELETAIRALMPRTALDPRPEVWTGIVARRAAGERCTLPEAPARTTAWRWSMLGAAAVLLLSLVPTPPQEHAAPARAPEPAAVSPLPGRPGNPLLPEALFAQGSPRPAYRSVAGPIGLRVQPGRWTYRWRSNGKLRGDSTYESVPAEVDGVQAWLLVRPGGDSLWATRDSLRPFKRVRQVAAGRLEQFYRPGEILTGLTMRGFTSWTADTADSTQGLAWAMVRWTEIVPLLQGIQLHRHWTGSIPLTASAFGRTWFNLRVDGEEDVVVPVGRFRCWRLTLLLRPSETFGTYFEDHPIPAITLWVSQNPQWLVQGSVTFLGLTQRTVVLANVDSVGP